MVTYEEVTDKNKTAPTDSVEQPELEDCVSCARAGIGCVS